MKGNGNTNFDVTSEYLLEQANKMQGVLDRIKTIFNNLDSTVNATATQWQSNAGDDVRNKYKDFSKIYPKFEASVDRFIKFLKNSSGTYESTEEAIKKASQEYL